MKDLKAMLRRLVCETIVSIGTSKPVMVPEFVEKFLERENGEFLTNYECDHIGDSWSSYPEEKPTQEESCVSWFNVLIEGSDIPEVAWFDSGRCYLTEIGITEETEPSWLSPRDTGAITLTNVTHFKKIIFPKRNT